MSKKSSFNRSEILKEMANTEYDLLVIGGGITGAGIALDASSRGLKTALVEKQDFASGTSSRSTKLIHGGLRYLKQLDVALVRETGQERAVVHKLAPHLVVPEKMLLPIIEGGTYGKWAASFGLKVYDMVAGVSGNDRRKMLNKKETLEKEPLLNADKLIGGGYYAEYRTDDARLTIENIKTAIQHGATVSNYLKVIDFVEENGSIKGVLVKDEIEDEEFEIKSKVVVSATGPWVDKLRTQNKSLKGKRLHLTKGVHIVVPHELLPMQQSLYFDVTDGRMIFAIPRGKITYIGTTDTDYKGNINEIRASSQDIEYILKAVNDTLDNIQLKESDILSSWAGLRPLIHEEGKSASELSRKDEIFEAPNGLVSIAGGKLTGYRKMAERIVDLVLKKFFDKNAATQTDKIVINGGDFDNYEAVKIFTRDIEKIMRNKKLSKYDAEYLVHLYGRQAHTIAAKMRLSEDMPLQLLLTELDFCLENELIQSPCDFFIRRTGRLYFDIESVIKYKDKIIQAFGEKMEWTPLQKQFYKDDLEKEIQMATHFEQEYSQIS